MSFAGYFLDNIGMAELIHNFGIDWKLLLAQFVNFVILFFVLWKFAYKPILGMLKKRREDIEKGIKFTKDAEEKLKTVGVRKEKIIEEAKGLAVSIVDRAQDLAGERKEEAIKETTKKAENIIAEAKRAANEEKAKIDEQAYKEAEQLVREGLEKVLQKIPADVRDGHLIKEALKELKTIKS